MRGWLVQRKSKAGVISGRLATQLVVVAALVVFLTSYALLKSDGTQPAASTWNPDVVPVLVDKIMKAPVSMEQDDPRLIQRIRSMYLYPPSSESYNLASENDDPSMGQSKQIREILGDQNGGFFIECGALDGETRSNTLIFEKRFGWKGVLVEGDPKNFDLMRKKNRKAWSVNGCLSTFPYPNTVMFQQHFNVGKISKLEKGKHQSGYVEVQCLPIYSILLALNTTTVDYFSLDVEGAELDVLSTIPWEKVNIKTLSVEFYHGGKGKGKEDINKYMISKGYSIYSEVTNPRALANDVIYAKTDFLEAKKKNTGANA